MSEITLYTLVPSKLSDLQQKWLDQCVDSVVETSFSLKTISCYGPESWYIERKKMYTKGGFMGCLDADDFLNPIAAEEMYQAIIGSKYQCISSEENLLIEGRELNPEEIVRRPSVPSLRDIVSHPRVFHHLTILNASLVPRHLFDTIESLGLQKNVDWVVKAYVALKYPAAKFRQQTYNWRIHKQQHSLTWGADYEKISCTTRNFLKCLLPTDSRIFTPVDVLESKHNLALAEE